MELSRSYFVEIVSEYSDPCDVVAYAYEIPFVYLNLLQNYMRHVGKCGGMHETLYRFEIVPLFASQLTLLDVLLSWAPWGVHHGSGVNPVRLSGPVTNVMVAQMRRALGCSECRRAYKCSERGVQRDNAYFELREMRAVGGRFFGCPHELPGDDVGYPFPDGLLDVDLAKADREERLRVSWCFDAEYELAVVSGWPERLAMAKLWLQGLFAQRLMVSLPSSLELLRSLRGGRSRVGGRSETVGAAELVARAGVQSACLECRQCDKH